MIVNQGECAWYTFKKFIHNHQVLGDPADIASASDRSIQMANNLGLRWGHSQGWPTDESDNATHRDQVTELPARLPIRIGVRHTLREPQQPNGLQPHWLVPMSPLQP